jgi:adenosine deaminase
MTDSVLLHDHLDGGVREATLLDLSNGRFSGYRDPSTGSLSEYLKTFVEIIEVIQSSESLERVALEAVEDLYSDGVRYFEIRFAPTLHTKSGLSVLDVVEAVSSGIKKGVSQLQDIHGGVILCALRGEDPRVLTDALGSLSNLREVVGVDLAGDETLGDVKDYRDFFKEGKRHGLGVTVHAGETGSWRNVLSSIDAGADRIGHGLALDKAPEEVKRELIESGVCLEMCLSSNAHTGALNSIDEHPAVRMLRQGFNVTLNTDNRSVSKTSMSLETHHAYSLGCHRDEIKYMRDSAIRAAFTDEATKRWIDG